VAGNFGISTQITEEDGPKAWIKVNPPQLGVWLRNFAVGQVWLESGEEAHHRLRLRPIKSSKLYPEYEADFDGEGQVQAKVRVFAPLSLQSATNFLPGLFVQVSVSAPTAWKGRLGFSLERAKLFPDGDDIDEPWGTHSEQVGGESVTGAIRGPAILGVSGTNAALAQFDGDTDAITGSVPVSLNRDEVFDGTFLVATFDPNGRYVASAPTPGELLKLLVNRRKELEKQLKDFEAALPCTGDADENRWLHWYLTPGILLTKGDRDGHVLTMGYRELNPRDSFWTSGMHLVFWPDLERKMISEIMDGQAADGHIPSTVLPTLDRGDQLDTLCYFILRVSRYYDWYRDRSFLTAAWPAVQRSIAYLHQRDKEDVGVPMQLSYWADWKDVPAVQGRKYAPHFDLLWLASVKAAAKMAGELGDKALAQTYGGMADKAFKFINTPIEQGGMWNGRNYVDIWYDGRRTDYVLEDQTVGAYFDVIPPDRLRSIYEALEANETRWGVRETFPYHDFWTDRVGGAPGNYHNGGIWPWLNFEDIVGRYNHGYIADADLLLHEVATADLPSNSDEHPNEYLNGDTGENKGFPLQGWDADFFMAIYFGKFGLIRNAEGDVELHLRTKRSEKFSSQLVLPLGSGTLFVNEKRVQWVPSSASTDVAGSQVRIIDERTTVQRP
jgi:glycogen debranching enzyme